MKKIIWIIITIKNNIDKKDTNITNNNNKEDDLD